MGMGMGMTGRGNFFINDTAMDMNVIDQTIKLNTTEIWEIHNDSMMMHPFHIHSGVFQILDRDGKAPHANEMGYKDSVKVAQVKQLVLSCASRISPMQRLPICTTAIFLNMKTTA